MWVYGIEVLEEQVEEVNGYPNLLDLLDGLLLHTGAEEAGSKDH